MGIQQGIARADLPSILGNGVELCAVQAAQRLAQAAACCDALAQLAQHMGLRARHGAPVALRPVTRAHAGIWKAAGLSSYTGNPTARGGGTQMLHGDAQMRADDEK